jgi:sulfide:quinone oxidoreductase
MIQQVVILGGGTAGTLTANRLQREIGGRAAITVVDRDAADGQIIFT